MFDFGICASFRFFFFFFFVKNMDITTEQCSAIKYCVRCGKTVIKTLSELKKAYGDECLTKATVLKWHTIFVKDPSAVPMRAKPTGRPCSQIMEVNINMTRAVIGEDRQVSIRQLEDTLHLSWMTIHQILTQELKMWQVCSAWVLHMLTLEQAPQKLLENIVFFPEKIV